jgi:hypothetical protein
MQGNFVQYLPGEKVCLMVWKIWYILYYPAGEEKKETSNLGR